MLTKFNALPLVSLGAAVAQGPSPQDELIGLVTRGHYPAAKQLAERLIEEASKPGSAAGVAYRAGLYELLGTAENALQHYAEAQRALELGMKLCEQHRPPLTEQLVSMLVSLAESHVSRANVQEANRLLRRALATATAGLPPDHPRLASVLDALGLLHWVRGESARAEDYYRRAVDILEARLGPGNPDLAVQRIMLATILLSSNRQAEALALMQKSMSVLERTHGRSHPRTVFAGYNLGLAQLKNNPAEAERVFRASMAAWLESQPEKHTSMAKLLNALAGARLAQGDSVEALQLNARALEILRDVMGAEHPEVVSLMYDRAALLAAGKHKKEAAAMRAEADRIRRSAGYVDPGRHSVDIQSLRIR